MTGFAGVSRVASEPSRVAVVAARHRGWNPPVEALFAKSVSPLAQNI